MIPIKKDKDKDNPSHIMNFLESYLQEVLKVDNKNPHLLLFLELSTIEKKGDFLKYKETYINKRAGGRYNENKLLLRCGAFCGLWNKRYIIITSEGVMYSKAHTGRLNNIRENLLFDHHFQLRYGKRVNKQNNKLE